MREIARRFALTRRLVATGTVAATVLAVVAAVGVPSAMAAGSLKITTSYQVTPISADQSDSIGFAIANSTGATVTNLTFQDALPTGVMLDQRAYEGVTNISFATTCGTATAVNPATNAASASGDTAVSVTVASVPSVASGTVCTVSFGVLATTPSVADVAYTDVLSSTFTTPKPVLTPAGIVVLSDPVLTVTRPAKRQTFKLGQIVSSNFSCAATDPLDVLGSVFATDKYSNQINPYEAIDTVDPGKNTLQVKCFSATGTGETTESVNYRVSSYKIGSVTASSRNGEVTFKSAVPAGTFVVRVLDGKQVIGKARSTVHYRHTATVAVKLTAGGKALLDKAKGKKVKVSVAAAFTPAPVGIGPDRISPSGPIDVTALAFV